MNILNNKITDSSETYQLIDENKEFTIKECDNIVVEGSGIYAKGSEHLKQPDINLIKANNVTIKGTGFAGLTLDRTRIKAQAFSKNLRVENVTFLDSHTSSISAKTEWHLDKSDYFDDQNPAAFIWDYIKVTDCQSYRPKTEMIYCGSQKTISTWRDGKQYRPHYFGSGVFENIYAEDCGREFGQWAHFYNLQIKNCYTKNSGRNNEKFQNNGMQISNSHGIVKKCCIDGTHNDGLLVFSYGMTFQDIVIKDIPNTAIFIGQVNKRFPESPLNDGRDLIFINPVIENAENGFDIQTDEMNVYIINPIFRNVKNPFHPKANRSRVHVINVDQAI